MEKREERLNQLKELLKENGLEQYSQFILDNVKPVIRVETIPLPKPVAEKGSLLTRIISIFKYKKKEARRNNSAVDTIEVGVSKFGGVPDLPLDFVWPVCNDYPMSFLCQYNLKELKPYDAENLLPEQGMISVFYDYNFFPWGDTPDDYGGWKVLYFNDLEALHRYKGLDSMLLEHSNLEMFHPCELNYVPDISLMPVTMLTNQYKLSDEEEESYCELRSIHYNLMIDNQVFGYCCAIQDDEIEKNCKEVSSTVFKDEKSLDDWLLLFQIDSDQNAHMSWGDCGKLYFCIGKQNLLDRNFDKVWMEFQCY